MEPMEFDLFTQDELKMFRTPGSVRRINGRLIQAQHAMRPLHFLNLTIHRQFLHIGPGIFHTRWITGGIHQHPDLQLEYPLSGRFRFHIDNQAFDLHGGKGLFIPSNAPHRWEVMEKGSMLGVFLEIDGADRKAFLDRMKKAAGNGKGVLISDKAEALAKEAFFCLARPRMDLGGLDKIAGLLDLFHIELIEKQCDLMRWRPPAAQDEAKDAERARQLAERAMRFLEANHTHSVQLHDVAMHVGVSLQHISRVFSAHYNATIKKTLLRIRLEHAFQMLSEHPDYSVKAIAYDCGFSTAAYFTRCFRKAYGFNPTHIQGR
ncbi:MAG: AraC family transcriptional regulator [Verrucomicrobiota bacterium]